MRRLICTALAFLSLGLIAGCDAKNKMVWESDELPAVWGVSAPTSSFNNGGTIPDKYAAPSNISPPLSWKPFVAPVVEYVIIVEDVDAKDNPTTNWLVYGIPAQTTSLDEGAATSGKLTQGVNFKGTIGYTGPDPDSSKPHRYYFELFALYQPIGLKAGANTAAVVAAMKNKLVAKSYVEGIYQKAPSP